MNIISSSKVIGGKYVIKIRTHHSSTAGGITYSVSEISTPEFREVSHNMFVNAAYNREHAPEVLEIVVDEEGNKDKIQILSKT